jgi:hypothetical protein
MPEYRLHLTRDVCAESPAEWGPDKTAFVVADSRYFTPDLPAGWSVARARAAYLNTSRDPCFVVLPLYAVVHGGVHLSLTHPRVPFDSGPIGYVVVRPYPGVAVQVQARGIVDAWNTYLSGDVWEWRVTRVDRCDLGHEHETVVDSWAGCYGEAYARAEGEQVLRQYNEGVSHAV